MRDAHCTNRKIRLGTGGTMMMNYSPYKMAETFKTLSAYAPGKIDFGAGRAPGGYGKSILALSEGKDTRFQDLYKKFSETLHLMNDENGEDYFNQNVVANPTGWRTALLSRIKNGTSEKK